MTDQILEDRPYPLLMPAFRRGVVGEIEALFARFPETEHAPVPGFSTWLHYAAVSSPPAVTDWLLARGHAVDTPDRTDGVYPIVNAVGAGRMQVVQRLLAAGATLDTSLSVRNPLFAAIPAYSFDRETPPETWLEIVRLLIDAGIDTRVRYDSDTMDHMDAMAFASMWGRQDIARLIAEHQHPGNSAAAEAALADARVVAERNSAHNDQVAREQRAQE